MTLLAARFLLAPLCVVAVSLAGRRWGIAAAGVLGGLPVVAGPILLAETLIHGRGFALGSRWLPPTPSGAQGPATPPWWDLPVRALAALGLVLVLTAASGALGPHLSGLLAPFPVIASVLAVFTHLHGGFGQVTVLMRNLLLGFYGFAAFCFTLAVALPGLSTGAAFGLATAAALAVQAAIFLPRSRLTLGG